MGRLSAALSGLLICAAIATASAARASSVYPAPTKSRGGALTACPSVRGLQGFSAAAIREAKRQVGRFARVSLSYDLSVSDRAWQPNVRAAWKRESLSGHGREFVVGPSRGRRMLYASIVKYSCGQAILSHTITLTTVPGRNHRTGAPRCVACRTTFFLLDRSGRPLIYFVY